MPAIGYTGANQSHFTSRHYYEVGETNPYGRWGWLGRFLDRARRRGQPAAGPDARLRAPARPRGARRARGHRVAPGRLLLLLARGVQPDRRPDAQRVRRSRRAAHHRRRVGLRPRRGGRHRDLRRQLEPFPGRVHLPGVLSRHRLRAPSLGPGRDDQGEPAAAGGGDRGGRQLRHPLEPGAGALAADRHAPAPGSWPSSGTSRRVAWPTACSCTCGASSGGDPPRTGPAPTMGRPASAS